MRKLLLILLVSSSFSIKAQKAEDLGYSGVVKFSPVQFLLNTFQLSYEQVISKTQSFQINGGVCYYDRDYDYREGYIGEFQYRCYILRNETSDYNTLHNLYFSPYLMGKHFVVESSVYHYASGVNYYEISRDEFNAMSGGIIIGINCLVGKRFHIDMFFGGGLHTSNSEGNDNNATQPGFKGISLRGGIDLGINFGKHKK
jgi:hypothetical protein